MTSSFRTEQVGKHPERKWTIYPSKIGMTPYHLPGTLLCDFIIASDSKEKKSKWSDTEIALTKIVLNLHSQETKKKKRKKGENPQNVGVGSQICSWKSDLDNESCKTAARVNKRVRGMK